jgi:hypothetical protein
MGYQAVFKRYELKYIITAGQKERILNAIQPYMEADRFGRSTVRNIYYDTDDFVLARHSIAKPDFKEKLRVRSYSKADADSTVFVELKRKFDGIVYKRRVGLPETDAMRWMAGSCCPSILGQANASPQVASEIEYFKGLYSELKPVLYLSYDREAYRMKRGASIADGGTEFRVTFDNNILCREGDLSLRSDAYGTALLEDGKFLMELKCPGAIPLWMTHILSEEHIYKTSFSKYGTAYCRFISHNNYSYGQVRVSSPVFSPEARRNWCFGNKNGQSGINLSERRSVSLLANSAIHRAARSKNRMIGAE